jgi:hypothetical protein
MQKKPTIEGGFFSSGQPYSSRVRISVSNSPKRLVKRAAWLSVLAAGIQFSLVGKLRVYTKAIFAIVDDLYTLIIAQMCQGYGVSFIGEDMVKLQLKRGRLLDEEYSCSLFVFMVVVITNLEKTHDQTQPTHN